MNWTILTRGASLVCLALAVVLNAFSPDVGSATKLFADGAAAATALAALFMHPPWSPGGGAGNPPPAP